MSDSNVKSISIVGGALSDYHKAKTGKKPSRSRTPQKGGGAGSPGVIDQMGSTQPPPGATTSAQAVPIETKGLTASAAPVLKGGAKQKVVLEPPKKVVAKLAAPVTKGKTRKMRKIRVSLTGLGKRMTRHKKIQKDATVIPLDDVKKTLVQAKLIKPDSKAPETMLRQIYADYLTLKNKAL